MALTPPRPRRSGGRAAAAPTRLAERSGGAVLSIALCTLIFAAFTASRLTLRASFAELLPQDKESVVIANALRVRVISLPEPRSDTIARDGKAAPRSAI